MTRAVSLAARGGLAVTLFLLALAVSRWRPIYAEPPLDVRALPLVPWALGLAILAALTAREHSRHLRLRPIAWAFVAAGTGLLGVTALRGPSGVAADVRARDRVAARLAPGPVEIVPGDVPDVGRDWSLAWSGELRAPRTGSYRFWVEGRGRVELRLDGRLLLRAEAEQLDAGTDQLVGRGPHRLDVLYERTGNEELRAARIRGHRLRVGWTQPRGNGSPGGRNEMITPRYLGSPHSPALWWATDLLSLALATAVALLSLAIPWDRPSRLAVPRPLSAREWGWSSLGYAAVLILMSWPLATDLAGQGVVGRADGDLNTWILAWGAHALLHEPERLFQAPIFHPAPDALAFSENLLLPALLAAPFSQLGEPVLGYNVVFLVSALVSGLGVQLLVRRTSGDPLAAFVAGVLFAAGQHRWARMAHLHAHVTLFLPLAVVALDRYWAKRTLLRALEVGLLLALQALCSVYLGAITATLVGVALAIALLAGLRGRALLQIGAGLALAAVLVWPVGRHYLRMRAFNGIEWTLPDVEPHATTLSSYVAGGSRLYDGLTRRHMDPESHRRPLFPGLVPLILGVVGLSRAPARFRAVALAASFAAVLISLGPATAVYRLLHEHVLLFRGLRALNRFALIPVFSLSVLSGFALAGRKKLALASLAIALFEAAELPLDYGPYRHPSKAARWLAGREGAVLWLPIGEEDSQAMLEGLAHFRPLVNGYSGFTPRHHAWAAETLDPPDSGEALRYLRALGVTHVVSPAALSLPLLARFGDRRIFGVPDGPRAELVAPGAPAAVLWCNEFAMVDLSESRTVSRVAFTPGDVPWSSPPRVSLSRDGRSWSVADARGGLADTALSLANNPTGGLAELRFAPQSARFVRIDGLPSTGGQVTVSP